MTIVINENYGELPLTKKLQNQGGRRISLQDPFVARQAQELQEWRRLGAIGSEEKEKTPEKSEKFKAIRMFEHV